MSTRCNVHVFQSGLTWEQKIQLYHHCDGYPSNMIPLFAKAYRKFGKGWEAGRAGKAASFLCAADPGQFEPESGTRLHSDIEYFYELDVRNGKGGSLAEKPQWYLTVFKTAAGFLDSPDRKHLTKIAGPVEVTEAIGDRNLLDA